MFSEELEKRITGLVLLLEVLEDRQISTKIAKLERLDNMMSTVATSEILRTRTKMGCEH